ncbi:uncharacterized protein LOC116302451 [Actinia tenebrosa]|uniref:Uncharacterized protein LOC116302451 n=1 Tax=Actinia tenebrosa TaxID=6105 RepID=A0A6P8ILV3_ACTTE|nr:uncharacterized protein LOC116302451 [Actinia tenebrosa]
MKIICAGLMKTGTKSLTRALRVLGYKVYDFDDQNLHFGDEFNGLYFKNQVPDFYRMFKDVDVVVDFPSYFFFEELMEAFPEAKVILTVRTDEDAWEGSFKNQLDVIQSSFLTKYKIVFPSFEKLHRLYWKNIAAVFGITDSTATYIARKRYRWHNDRVKFVVPADKLLVFSVEQGWKPLCEFTGKDVPDQPFPHLNVKGEIMETFVAETEYGKKIQDEVKFVVNCLLIFLCIIGAVLLSYLLKQVF